jgi:hypothetical protein
MDRAPIDRTREVRRAQRRTGLHLRDEHIGPGIANPRHDTRLHHARLARTAGADDRGETFLAEHTGDEAVDQLILAEEASVIGLAKRSETEVGVLHVEIRRRRGRSTRRCKVEFRILEQYLLLQTS